MIIMKYHFPQIAMCLAMGSCVTPPKGYADVYLAPESLSFAELTQLGIDTFFSDNEISIAGNYVLQMQGNSMPLGGEATDVNLNASVPFAIAPDGFEVAFESVDLAMGGLLSEMAMPEFAASITASDNSGMHIQFSESPQPVPGHQMQSFYLNPDVYIEIKDVWKNMMNVYSVLLTDEEIISSPTQALDADRLILLLSQAMYDEMSVKVVRNQGNRFFYTADIGDQLYSVVKKVLFQVGEDNLLEFLAEQDFILAAPLEIYLALSEEQRALILPAAIALFNGNSEYEIAVTDNGTLIAVGYSFNISLPDTDELADRIMRLINVIPGKIIPVISREKILIELESYKSQGALDFGIDLLAEIQDLNLSSTAAGHFDFEKPDGSVDYSDIVGSQLPMIKQLMQQMDGVLLSTESADTSEVF